MNKVFRLAAVAIVAVSLTTACKSNKTEQPVEDSIPATEIEAIADEVAESIDTVAEEVVTEVAKTVKKAVKKEEPKANEVKSKNTDGTLPTATGTRTGTGNKVENDMNTSGSLPTRTGQRSGR